MFASYILRNRKAQRKRTLPLEEFEAARSSESPVDHLITGFAFGATVRGFAGVRRETPPPAVPHHSICAPVRHPDGLIEGAADPRGDGQAAGF